MTLVIIECAVIRVSNTVILEVFEGCHVRIHRCSLVMIHKTSICNEQNIIEHAEHLAARLMNRTCIRVCIRVNVIELM